MKELLHEAAKTYAIENSLLGYESAPYKGFIEGVVWAYKEVINNLYTEEEIRGLLIKLHNEFPDRWELEEWFEQNKKK